MKTNKILLSITTLVMIITLGLASTYANSGNYEDINSNWIADWQEDWDSDWILNSDDEDYIRTYENMKDDDWDWIANKDDEDYEKNPLEDWSNKQENAWNNWTWSLNNQEKLWTNWTGSLNKSENPLKTKYKSTYQEKYSFVFEKLDDSKLNLLINRIDQASEKINNSNSSEATKEKYNAMLWALREMAEENLDN